MNTHAPSTALPLVPASVEMRGLGEAEANVRSAEQLAKALWGRRLLIATCGIVLGAGVFAATKQLPKKYTATGLVAVDTQRITAVGVGGAIDPGNLIDPLPQVRSEALLMRSPAVLRKVADGLELAADPEFNPRLRPPGIVDRAKALLRQAAAGAFLPGPVVAFLAGHGIDLPAVAPEKEPAPIAVREMVLDSLSDGLALFNDGRSLVISASFTSESPERAAEVVNRLFESYLGEKREARASKNREVLAALRGRLEGARSELAAAEQRVRDFRAKHGLVSVRAGSAAQQRVEELAMALARASEERAR
ncbi:MAG: hypothetical protein ICV73_26440, partial [Acetobacteraceae bacterium]|nr:hypothetical protein [Acetobacteraceae bacterium]